MNSLFCLNGSCSLCLKAEKDARVLEFGKAMKGTYVEKCFEHVCVEMF